MACAFPVQGLFPSVDVEVENERSVFCHISSNFLGLAFGRFRTQGSFLGVEMTPWLSELPKSCQISKIVFFFCLAKNFYIYSLPEVCVTL